jgi:molybdate transport system substrate-binding protein
MAMRRMKVYDAVKPHLVIAENIAQAAQFVESGNAQLGLISLTAASSQRFKDAGSYVLVPTQTYTSIRQCAVVMAKSDRKAIAHAFLDWLLSSPVQERLPQMGLGSVR